LEMEPRKESQDFLQESEEEEGRRRRIVEVS
jgi:hypothetical protein